MPLSESQRRSRDRYDAAHMAYQTVKVRRELLEEFRQKVQDHGDRVNTVLVQAMRDYIESHSP